MNQLLKINGISIFYAIFLLVPTELMVNVYRISRVTGWAIDTVNTITTSTIFVGLILGTILFYLLTKKWLGRTKWNYITILSWIPYFVLFVYMFASLFPMTNRADDPNPVTGLLIIGMVLLYPIYIFLINYNGSLRDLILDSA